MANNIYLIIFILIIIAIIVYFYYNGKSIIPSINDTNDNNKIHSNNASIKTPKRKQIQSNLKKILKNNRKKVRFDDKINVFSPNKNKSNTKSKYGSKYNSNKPIDVDSIMGKEIDLDEVLSDNKQFTSKVMPANLDITDPEQSWYNNFGSPLIGADEKKKFYAKMQKNYKNYEKAMGEFTKYQTDNSTIIKTDVTIDPFKPENRNNKLKGKAIKDIYDEQVAGPKAKPKKIKHQTDTNVIYDNESELNGGLISGSNLCAFDNISDDYKAAAFGNEF